MRPISAHDRFFSSLNRVEKRLASEKEPISFATPPSPISFGSPLYLSSPKPQPASFKPSALDESSGPALEFLSIPPMVYDPAPSLAAQKDDIKYEEEDDEIDRLISLLGLSADGEDGGGGLGSCHCSGGGFYRKAVGVKGPICEKEMGRLDGWIEHYRRERREPARLAHLLLAKAVSMEASRGVDDDDDDNAFGAIEFPPTVEEFLEHDPPFQKALLQSYKAGIGGVFRDHIGRFLSAFGFKCSHWDIGALELAAFRYLKVVIKEWMVEAKGLIIEGDNINVIKHLQKSVERADWRKREDDFEDLSFLKDFGSFIFHFSYRNYNKLVDFCANLAL